MNQPHGLQTEHTTRLLLESRGADVTQSRRDVNFPKKYELYDYISIHQKCERQPH